MWTAKEFLAQECANLGNVLQETLRFKYGSDGSREFFEECQVRLDFLSAQLKVTQESDFASLAKFNDLLSELSGLIARIERSSVGEYSWPFVEQLKKIAGAACAEATLLNPKSPPKVHVLSEGGLDAYCIYPEYKRPSSSKKRILTIVFPRTLKNFVLLHSILGHELGHAMWRCSQHQHALDAILNKYLLNTGPFSDPIATAKWLYSSSAPVSVQGQLNDLLAAGIDEKNFFSRAADWDAWVEEILCDFIGLMTFGPSFIAACCNLLYAIDPEGVSIGPEHPPVACRASYLLTAATQLGLDHPQYEDTSLNESVTKFWQAFSAKRHTDAWFDVFTAAQIKDTADAIGQLLSKLPPAEYEPPGEEVLSLLLAQLNKLVPPVGFSVASDLSFASRQIDFRHVLYAGWITSANGTGIPFDKLNRLCEHGILQQMAIDIALAPDQDVCVK